MSDLLEDPLFVELLGAFIGDGWIEKRGSSMYICGSPTEDKWHYDNFIAPIFSKYFSLVIPRLFPYWGVYGVVIHKKSIINYALENGFSSGEKARSVSIPKKIMDSGNEDIMKAVIRGIFDTDGSFYVNKQSYFKDTARVYSGRISIGTTSKNLFNQLIFLFERLNFDFRTTSSAAKKCNHRNNSASYRLMINKQEEVDRFFFEIGTNNLRHATRYLMFKKFGYIPLNSSVDERLALLEDISTDFPPQLI